MGSSIRLLKIVRVLFSERIDELLPQLKRKLLKAIACASPQFAKSEVVASVCVMHFNPSDLSL